MSLRGIRILGCRRQRPSFIDEDEESEWDGLEATSSKGKRKAKEMADDEEEGAVSPAGDSKRAKTVAMELRKERIKRRALTGIAASLAIG